jgi:hypothetical protein
LEHDPEKWIPVFGLDHAQTKILDHDPLQLNWIVVLAAAIKIFRPRVSARLTSLAARRIAWMWRCRPAGGDAFTATTCRAWADQAIAIERSGSPAAPEQSAAAAEKAIVPTVVAMPVAMAPRLAVRPARLDLGSHRY